MTGLRDIIEAVADVLTTAGFKPTKDVFSFDAVPDSVIDRAFRIETRAERLDYQMSMIREIDETVSIWIAYKMTRSAIAARDRAATDRETIEKIMIHDEALSALDCNPIVMMTGAETAEYADIYLVSRIDFEINFVQDMNG